MKIAYFSPLNPQKSGISDFSEELLPELSNYMEIDLFVDGFKPTNSLINRNFKIYKIDDIYKDEVRNRYDFLIYHIGNNADYHSGILKAFMEFPGILELHDISLHNFMAAEMVGSGKTEEYKNLMKYCHGKEGEKVAQDFFKGLVPAPWETNPLKFTMTKHIIDRAEAIIVHSDFAKQMVKGIRVDIPVINIMHHTRCESINIDQNKINCRKSLNIDENILVFGSFGYASKSKRILEIIKAIGLFKMRVKQDFVYLIVGEVQEIDVESSIKELGLEKNVIITGFTSLDDFKLYMGACDFCINLRYPTQGESSGSLHRMLGMGKPVILTDIGSFKEYPNTCSIKVRHDENEVKDISEALISLATNKDMIKKMGMVAYSFANKYCNISKNAETYKMYLEQIKASNYLEDPIERLVDILVELGLTNDGYIEHIALVLKNVL